MRVTAQLRADIQSFYGLRSDVCNAEVRSEAAMLRRKEKAGVLVGDARLERLRAIFEQHGIDPLVYPKG